MKEYLYWIQKHDDYEDHRGFFKSKTHLLKEFPFAKNISVVKSQHLK